MKFSHQQAPIEYIPYAKAGVSCAAAAMLRGLIARDQISFNDY
jgi:hypothetical protein